MSRRSTGGSSSYSLAQRAQALTRSVVARKATRKIPIGTKRKKNAQRIRNQLRVGLVKIFRGVTLSSSSEGPAATSRGTTSLSSHHLSPPTLAAKTTDHIAPRHKPPQ